MKQIFQGESVGKCDSGSTGKWWKIMAPMFTKGVSTELELNACSKCESCLPCKKKEQNEVEKSRNENEFERNVTSLNRAVFTFMFICILVSNAGLWIYLSW
jgi:hypothetical protein